MRYVKFCPKCRSLDVRLEWKSFWFLGFPPSYACKKCGFKSMIFPEISTEKIKKKAKRKKNEKKEKI